MILSNPEMRDSAPRYRLRRDVAALFASPMPILGMIVGFLWARWDWQRDMQRFAAEHPGQHVCGLSAIAGIAMVLVCVVMGGFMGTIASVLLALFAQDE